MVKEQYIAISHFINPHLFWYHKVDGENPAFVEKRRIEDSIQGLFTAKQSLALCPYRPQVGEIIAVAFVSWNKYVRARVEYIEKFTHNEDQYIVWAIDYGFPFHTKINFVRKLPDIYKQVTDYICMGGIANLLPAELDFEFVTTTSKITCTKSWSHRAVELLEKVINDAASVSFIEEFCDNTTFQKHRFGDLKIINHSGNEFYVSDYLIKLNYAVKCGDDFMGRLEKIKTKTASCWESVNRNNKIVQNRMSTFNINFANQSQPDCGGSSETSSDFLAKQKVIDWCERNKNFDNVNEERNVVATASAFDATDISFDDSVSVKKCETNEVNEDDGLDEPVMGIAGKLHKARKDKYKEKIMPPKPAPELFEVISDKSEVAKSSVNNLSKRTKALMELRKKHQQKGITEPAETNAVEERMADLTLSSLSGCSTEEYLAACKERNAQTVRLKNLKEQSCDSAQDQPDESGSVSVTSSRIQRLQRIKQKYAEQREKELHGSQAAQPDDYDVHGQSDNRISSHIARLIDIRRKAHVKYSQTNKDESVCKEEHSQKPGTSVEQGNLMPQATPKQQDSLTPAVATAQSSPSTGDSSTLHPTSSQKKEQQADLRKVLNENPFKSMTVVPAGFDVTKLVPRHNKDTHWHTKKSTLNDPLQPNHLSGDDSGNNSDNWNTTPEKVPRRTEDVDQQNFRLTRSRKERKKSQSEPVNEKHLLDQSLNDDDCEKAISPEILSNTPDEKLIDLSAKSELLDNSNQSNSSSTDSFVKFVKAKSPVVNTISLDLLTTESNGMDSSSISTGSFTKISSIASIPKKSNDDLQITTKGLDKVTNSSVSSETFGPQSIEERLAKEECSSYSSSLERAPLLPNDTQSSTESQSLIATRKPVTQASSNLTTSDKCNTQPCTIPEIPGEGVLKTNLIQHLVMAHSRVKVTPVDTMSKAMFTREVQNEMENMRLTKIYRIQAYAWAHLARGNSFFVINGSRTGKSWCYLPPLCSMLAFHIQSASLTSGYGPMAVVIAPSSKQVESIARYCRHLLANITPRVTVVPSYGFRCAADVKIELHNGCGILVITPPSLRRLLVANETELLIDLQRIQCVVIDDMDTMLDVTEEFNEIFDKFVGPTVRQQNSIGAAQFQLIVTSKRWSREMIRLIRISNEPLLCIADFLEAAVYAKAKLSIRLQSSADKMSVVIKCLEKYSYQHERVVIVCSTADEVDYVNQNLLEAGYSCLAYTEYMQDYTLDLTHEWKMKAVCHQVLITMDAVLPEIDVQNAWTLIHYSLPISWTRFNFRFSTFLQNCENLLKNNFKKPNNVPKSIILLDENNNLQLPRLMEFMRQHNQLKLVQPDVRNVAAKVEAAREEQRVSQGVLMCPKVLEFGSCDESSRCPHRHQITKYDGPVDDIPTHGDVRLVILDVVSPTHYIARLLTHRQGNAWNKIKRSDEVARFLMRLSHHYVNDESHVVHWPLRVNDMCVYKGEEVYHRCRLLQVPPIVHEHIVKQVTVRVKLIDTGTTLMCRSHDLLVIPEEFRDFPAQAVDIRLSGVIPLDNENVWDSRSTQTVKKWIMTDTNKNDCLQANINFALMNVIWVNNVILMESLPKIRGFVVKINVKRSLIGKDFALATDQIHPVKHTAMEIGLLGAKISPDVSLDKPNDDTNLMEFSKSTSITENEHKSVEKPAQSTQEVPVPKPITKSTTSKNNQKAVIEEEWERLAVEELQEVMLEEFCDPSKFYVRLQRHSEDLKDLQELIRSQATFPLDEPHPMQNCLAPRGSQYYRAKIKRLIVDSDGCIQARIFFCDLGCFATYPLEKLRATSQMLTEYMPFQAICCKLIGVRVDVVGEKVQDVLNTKSGVHMSYAVKECFDSDDYDERFHIRHYEILLYECFSGKSDTLVNKLLVDRGLASYNDDTRHFLELQSKAEFEKNGSGEDDSSNSFDFSAFLERIKDQMDEEDAYKDDELPTCKDKSISEVKSIEITENGGDEQMTEEQVGVPVKTKNDMPALKPLYRRPQTTWYQTMCMIFIVIRTPDISDYHLEVAPDRLTFIASVNGEKQLLILDMLGYVQPELVMHEIRGLNVVVRLVKNVYIKWPRLLKDPTKASWLIYNYNSIDATEEERLLGEEYLRRRGRARRSNDSDSSTGDSDPWETYTPIVNGDEIYDPIGDFF